MTFQIQFHKHDANEVFKAMWVSDIEGHTIATLTDRCVETDYLVTCDVTAGVDLKAGDPPVLNIINVATEYAPPLLDQETASPTNPAARPKDIKVTGAVFVSSVPDVMITLDGFNASDSGSPTVFRP